MAKPEQLRPDRPWILGGVYKADQGALYTVVGITHDFITVQRVQWEHSQDPTDVAPKKRYARRGGPLSEYIEADPLTLSSNKIASEAEVQISKHRHKSDVLA
jgi:hypothetical protein